MIEVIILNNQIFKNLKIQTSLMNLNPGKFTRISVLSPNKFYL